MTPVRSLATVFRSMRNVCVCCFNPLLWRVGVSEIHSAPSRIVTEYSTLACTSTSSVCPEASTSRRLSPTRMAFFFCWMMVKR